MKVTNWGNFPVIDAEIFSPTSYDQVRNIVLQTSSLIARGLGRCYGDSSLNENILSTLCLNHILSFDNTTGSLTCEAGVSLEEILDAFVPRGWFLPVTPGTKFVTLGGAIASDVHGKNHHVAGSFANYVESLLLLQADGTILRCSKNENKEIFEATCGGMGLTGIILEATLFLKKIETAYIRQEIEKAKNLDQIFEIFNHSAQWTYSVAWIDCLAKGNSLGRSVLIRGEHAGLHEIPAMKNPLKVPEKIKVSVPFNFPEFTLSTYVVKIFNELWDFKYSLAQSVVDYNSFFYPLDSILKWNRIYGKRGLTQYQCVFPKEPSYEGIKQILTAISNSGEGSPLGVLKLFGKQNGLLSFPLEGYTLAIDFPAKKSVFELFKKLDEIVLKHGGRLYLTKDSRMSEEMFKKGYEPALSKFKKLKAKVDTQNKFQSFQSRRLEI